MDRKTPINERFNQLIEYNHENSELVDLLQRTQSVWANLSKFNGMREPYVYCCDEEVRVWFEWPLEEGEVSLEWSGGDIATDYMSTDFSVDEQLLTDSWIKALEWTSERVERGRK